MRKSPDQLARALRSAVLAADHEEAALLTVEYSEALREHWMALGPEERAGSPVPKHSLELLNWVREMTIMQQAIAAEHLKLVGKAIRYQTARALYLQSAAL